MVTKYVMGEKAILAILVENSYEVSIEFVNWLQRSRFLKVFTLADQMTYFSTVWMLWQQLCKRITHGLILWSFNGKQAS